MPEFDSKRLRVDTIRECWKRADEIISFTDLICRWPYHAVINIAYELHPDIYDDKIVDDNPPLALYLCDDIVIGQNEQEVFHLCPVHINTPFDPFLSNIPKLFVLKSVVERLETQNPNYAGKRPLKTGESTLLLATPKNLKEVAICILWAWKQAMKSKQKIKDGDYSLTSDFWTETRTTIDRLLLLAPDILDQPFTLTEYPKSAGEGAKQRAQEFVKQFKLTTDEGRLIALEALFDAHFPSFSNEELGELLWPDRLHIENATRKRYGTRLCNKLKEERGKKWR